MRGLNISTWILGAALALTATSTTGCAKRLSLSPKQLAKVKDKADLARLNVYTERKLLVFYDEASIDENFEVSSTITDDSAKVVDKRVTKRNTPGIILEIGELNGKPLLYVTFDGRCRDKSCAFRFVETEDGHYRLSELAKREGYNNARAYRACKWKKRHLKLGKLASLAEANEVYLVKKNNGDILTMELQVKVKKGRSTTTKVDKDSGIKVK